MPRDASETRDYAKHHLVYEIQMVSGLVDRFERLATLLPTLRASTAAPAELEVIDLVGRNADIESFAIHSRALIDFLYGKKVTKKDCVARDFFMEPSAWPTIRPAKSKVLRSIPSRASIEVAHLSYDRRQPAPPWDYKAIWASMREVLRAFIKGADQARLGADAREQIAGLVSARTATPSNLRELVAELERASLSMVVGATEGLDVEIVDSGGTAIIKPSEPFLRANDPGWASGD
jgi:hypothetical protein